MTALKNLSFPFGFEMQLELSSLQQISILLKCCFRIFCEILKWFLDSSQFNLPVCKIHQCLYLAFILLIRYCSHLADFMFFQIKKLFNQIYLHSTYKFKSIILLQILIKRVVNQFFFLLLLFFFSISNTAHLNFKNCYSFIKCCNSASEAYIIVKLIYMRLRLFESADYLCVM